MNNILQTKLSHAIFRAKSDIKITDKIVYHLPTVDEVYEFGFEKYMANVSLLTSVGMDLPLVLDELGEDFTKIDDFFLFCKYLIPSSDYDVTSLLFPNCSFSNTHFMLGENDECLALVSADQEILMTREIYEAVVQCLRASHMKKRNDIVLIGQSAKEAYLEDAWMDSMIKEDTNDDVPSLEDLLSTMVNDPGFLYNQTTVFDMKFVHFLDAVYRSNHVQNANLLLSSGYSGFGVDLKKINKKELNRFAKIDY